MTDIKLPYVPAVLQFIPAIISNQTSVSSVYSAYKLLITQEATTNYSAYQALPQQYVVTVPTSGVVRLKLLLLESSRFKQAPINRYKVYYYSGQELVDEQYWVVPNLNLPFQTVTIHNDGLGEGVVIPNNLYEVTEIRPEVQYTILNNLLYFDNSAPVGDYVVSYQPGLTLYDLVYSS